MSYKYCEIKDGHKLSEMTESEIAYIHAKWERLCARANVNTSEQVFIQCPDGLFLNAVRIRESAIRGHGSAGCHWSVRVGTCKAWKFAKNPFGSYDPEQTDKYYTGIRKESGEIINVPATVKAKKDVIELAQKLGWI